MSSERGYLSTGCFTVTGYVQTKSQHRAPGAQIVPCYELR